MPPLQTPIASNITARLPEAKIKQLFDELDSDKSGDITLAELETAGKNKKLGPLYSLESCKSFLKLADTDGSNTLDYEEFKAWVQDRENVLLKLFCKLDVDNSGCVCASRFQEALKELGLVISLEEAKKIIDRLDDNSNGTLEYDELRSAALILHGDTNEIIHKVLIRGENFLMFEDDAHDSEVPALRILVAGIISGSIARTLTAPQDRVAMNMRAGKQLIAETEAGMLSMAKHLVHKDGIRGLWLGNGVNCLKDGPRSGITFLAYERYKSLLVSGPGNPSSSEKFLCGGLAGLTSMTMTYPLLVAQARIAVSEKGHYRGLVDCLRSTLRTEGRRGFTRGFDAAALGLAPERGISLMAYSTLREILVEDGQSPSLAQSLTFGAVSSLTSQTVTAPMQTIMVRLMAQGESLGRPVVYHSAFDCFRKIVYGSPNLNLPSEGFRALFRGLPAHLLKMIPGTAIQFAAFEFFSEKVQGYTG